MSSDIAMDDEDPLQHVWIMLPSNQSSHASYDFANQATSSRAG